MIEIQVLFYGSTVCWHWRTHTAAIVTDLDKNIFIPIEYPGSSPCKPIDGSTCNKNAWFRDQSDANIIKLYSNISLDDFAAAYNKQFNPDDYGFFSKNCANAVEFVLDYFFPNKTRENIAFKTYQLLCCTGFFATVGGSCFPAVCCATPADVYRKAWLLQKRFGKASINLEKPLLSDTALSDKESKPPSQEVMKESTPQFTCK